MTTLEAIIAELRRQAAASASGSPVFGFYLPADEGARAIVNGSVDLVAIAAAVDKARADEQAETRSKIDAIFADIEAESENRWRAISRLAKAAQDVRPGEAGDGARFCELASAMANFAKVVLLPPPTDGACS